MASQYGPSAKRRIVEQGATEVARFIDEVPLDSRTRILNGLPSVPGFRPKQMNVERRKRFIARLTEAPIDDARHAADSDWATLRLFWVEWGCSVFGEGARAVLKQQSVPKNEDDAEVAMNLVVKLEAAVGPENLAREDFARLLHFSGYDDAALVDKAIQYVPTRAQRERERRLEKLAPKLAELEVETVRMEAAWQSGLETVTAKLVGTEDLLKEFAQSATGAARRFDELGQQSEDEKRRGEALGHEVRQLVSELSILQDQMNGSIATLTEHLGAARKDTAAALEQMAILRDGLDALNRRSSETETAVEQLQDHVTAGASEGTPTLDQGGYSAERSTPAVIWSKETLGPVLFKASPAKNPGLPRLLVIDAALRARELPLLIGPLAREFAEAWLATAGGGDPVVMSTDPTLLSLQELTPRGSRGGRAPLAEAFARAGVDDHRPVVVVLDDLDPAASGFWLPELARAWRRPSRYGFPSNLVFIALIEADASQMGLSQARAAELFPLTFGDCKSIGIQEAGSVTAEPGELSLELLVQPTSRSSLAARVAAIDASARHTFEDEDSKTLSMGLASFLRHAKGMGPPPGANDALGNCLLQAARLLVRE